MTEQQLQSSIIKLIETEYNGYVIKIITGNKAGQPDLVCCIDSLYVGLEVKLPGKESTLSELQKVHLQLIKDSKGTSAMVSSVESVRAILDHLLGIETEMEV